MVSGETPSLAVVGKRRRSRAFLVEGADTMLSRWGSSGGREKDVSK